MFAVADVAPIRLQYRHHLSMPLPAPAQSLLVGRLATIRSAVPSAMDVCPLPPRPHLYRYSRTRRRPIHRHVSVRLCDRAMIGRRTGYNTSPTKEPGMHYKAACSCFCLPDWEARLVPPHMTCCTLTSDLRRLFDGYVLGGPLLQHHLAPLV